MAKVLVCDQSTMCTGYSWFISEQYIESGIIDMSKSKLETNARSFEMAKEIWKIIKHYNPGYLILEDVQQQSNPKTMLTLARLQGMIIGYAEAHKVKVYIVAPSQWRAQLKYAQGPKVKRAELKQQSLDYVKEHLNLTLPEDQAEACCIGFAAHKIFNFE